MKKQFYLLALLLLVTTSGFAQFILRATVPSTTLTCYAAGNFNSWGAGKTQLALLSTDDVKKTKLFVVELPLTFINSGTFKILAGSDWSFEQADAQFSATTDVSATSQDVVVTAFKAMPSPIEINVTVPLSVKVCYAVGGPWGWTLPTAAQQMSLISEDMSSKVFAIVVFDKTSSHNINVKFLAGLDGANWTYSQTATDNFVYVGTESYVNFVCNAFNAYQVPVAVSTITSDNYSINASNRKIEVAGKYSNVSLFNMQGKMIQTSTNPNAFISNDLTPGMYIIRVDNKAYKQVIN